MRAAVEAADSVDHDFELVIVSYRSRGQLEQLLAGLPTGLPVAIVDNARGEDGVEELIKDRPAARYLDSGGGKGFAKAANIGARTSTYEHVVFVNPDSRPRLEDLHTLVTEVRTQPRTVAAAATTVDAHGRVEIGVGGWEPTFGRALVHAVGLHKLVPTAGLWARPAPGSPVQVDWTSGACLAVHRDVFLELGGFDERYFVYNDDMAFGRRVREAGLRQSLRTDLLVLHQGAGSGGASGLMFQQRGASMVAYLRDHNGRVAAEAIRIALTVGSLARLLLFTCLRRRTRIREHSAYLRGLWRGSPVMT